MPGISRIAVTVLVVMASATSGSTGATPSPSTPTGDATVPASLAGSIPLRPAHRVLTGELDALSRADGLIVWTSRLPAGSNSTLAITGDTLLAGAGLPLSSAAHPALVAYRLA